MTLLVRLQPCAALAAPAGWQCCPCQPLVVRPRRARLDRLSVKVRAEEEEKVDVKSFFSGNSNAVRVRLKDLRLTHCITLRSKNALYHCVSQSACFLQSRGYTDEDSAGQSNIFAVEVSPQSVLSHSMTFYQSLSLTFRLLVDIKCMKGF